MAKGSSSRSGPAPDPNALRRDRDYGDWIQLPQAGRLGETPKWPLSTKANQAEAAYWAELWTMPQAVVWERQSQFHEVALYCRKFVEASKPKSTAGLVNATRQMAESLGLTVPGLQRNKWRISTGAPVVPEEARGGPTAGPSSRDRFRVVDGTG